jgi:hypothetical protein
VECLETPIPIMNLEEVHTPPDKELPPHEVLGVETPEHPVFDSEDDTPDHEVFA